MKKIATLAVLAALTLTGCGATYTYEAEPVGGVFQDPRQVECFHIEADSSAGDDGDIQLGSFCTDEAAAGDVEDDD